MGKEVFEQNPGARKIFEKADEVLGFPLTELCFEGPAEELTRTHNTQPAVLATSIATYEFFESVKPDFTAGHSLGEYSALVVSGALTFEDALMLVRKRGKYMQEACPEGEGKMAAVIGLNRSQVEKICKEEAREEALAPANLNAPKQIVISGKKEAVERASKRAKQEDARRVIPLDVSAPFHCELMKPAEEKLKKDLEETSFEDPEIPVIANCSGEAVKKGSRARKALIRQVCSPVRWVDSMQYLEKNGVGVMAEIGPGRVLKGLQRRINGDIDVVSVSNSKDFSEFKEKLRE